VVQLARERTPEAIEALTAALANPRERVAAATVLLDRAWGKAAAVIIGDEDRPIAVSFEWAAAAAPPPTIEAQAEATDTEAGELTVTWRGSAA
jgi:hypothetical protein